MESIKEFFLLRWNLPHWVIPLVWILYVLRDLFDIGSKLITTFRNLAPEGLGASFVISATVLTLIPAALQLAFVGILLFTAQYILFQRTQI